MQQVESNKLRTKSNKKRVKVTINEQKLSSYKTKITNSEQNVANYASKKYRERSNEQKFHLIHFDT